MAESTRQQDNFKSRYPDHVYPTASEAVRFLLEIANHGRMTLVTISVNGHVRPITYDTSDCGAVEDMRSFIAFNETQPHQVFYLPNLANKSCIGAVPGREDIEWIRSIVLDFDPDRDKPLHEERDRLRQIAYDLIHGPLQPRAIVDTGGGMQVVYQLLQPIAVTADSILEVELLMKSLARSMGADTATCTVKNLFRVPGTFNWPTPAKKKAGRERTVSGIWHLGGPKCTLVELRALATVTSDDAPASAPVEFDNLSEQDVIAVLGEPSALPGHLIDLLRDPILQKAMQRPPPPDDTSGGDFYLACVLARHRLPPCDVALVLSAYGHKVHTAFSQQRLFSYIIGTVEEAVAKTQPDLLLVDLEDEVDREEAEARKKEHRARLKPLTLDEALQGLFEAEQNYLVQGFLRQGELMVLYGKPGCGKTFVGLDLSFHLAHGQDWNGCKVRQSAVVYIAAELPFGIRYRLKALVDRYGATDKFFLVATTVNMFDPRIDLTPLMNEIAGLNVDIGLIVIDTLARTMIGGNENSTQDMSRLVANGDTLRDRFQTAVAWVHHTGKNEAAGARGSSALVAATDTEIEITDFTFRSTKMRDRDDISFRFRLHPAPVGTLPDGDIITSCTVNWIDEPGPVGQNTPETNNLKLVVDLLRMRGQPLTLREIIAEAELMGRTFTIKQNSLERALNRACESDTSRIFTRELTDKRAGKNFLYAYGLVNW